MPFSPSTFKCNFHRPKWTSPFSNHEAKKVRLKSNFGKQLPSKRTADKNFLPEFGTRAIRSFCQSLPASLGSRASSPAEAKGGARITVRPEEERLRVLADVLPASRRGKRRATSKMNLKEIPSRSINSSDLWAGMIRVLFRESRKGAGRKKIAEGWGGTLRGLESSIGTEKLGRRINLRRLVETDPKIYRRTMTPRTPNPLGPAIFSRGSIEGTRSFPPLFIYPLLLSSLLFVIWLANETPSLSTSLRLSSTVLEGDSVAVTT